MTNKEASIILKNTASTLKDSIKYLKEPHQNQFKEAYEMAIQAIKADVHGNNVGKIDIADGDRAVSLNAVLKIIDEWYDDKADIEDLIVRVTYMPSVTPQPCGDAISRKDAEKRIDEALTRVLVDSEGIGKKILSKLPSITPERPKGHWILKHRNINKIEYHTGADVLTDEIHTVKELIRYETDEPYCSECGKRADDIAQNYCGYCGAGMREEGEDKE